METKTLVVNLFGGPGAGKTTCAMEICVALKKQGIATEYIPEYAKELVYANRMELLDGSTHHQRHIYQEQKRKMNNALGKVDVIVTDSPIILSTIYDKEHCSAFEKEIIQEFYKHDNFNMFINRGDTFETNGRIHTLQESMVIDQKIKDFLKKYKICYSEYPYQTIPRAVKQINDELFILQNQLKQSLVQKESLKSKQRGVKK